ncbi:MAG: 1-deoxy-D-xylulose-5-phosphate reductoisomerase, partial [Desulfovibrionaceae bacterium]|nr:1-deoxy-D-xylulose-5-phosphate reductoisomerase [Desulfovibrionaceae bacterium]
AKISIDSATLMNKGLEVAEAFHLYGVPVERIRVLVHPQSLVHSLVELTDRSLLAQLGTPDMRMAIAHCLMWPHCAPAGVPPLDLTRTALTFHEPDVQAFPCLELARSALRGRGGLCVVLNAANEAAVELFLQKRCSFPAIADLISRALEAHSATDPGHAPLCPPLTTPAGADPLALAREVHILMQRIETLDRQSRALVHELAQSGEYSC